MFKTLAKVRNIRAVRWFATAYLGLLIVLVALERGMVYSAPARDLGDWSPSHPAVEDVFFESADGTRLHGWFLPHAAPQEVVLLCHGNAEHVAFLLDDMIRLSTELEASVLAFDYRGYGKSDGKPFERGVLEDGEAAQRWLAKRTGISPKDAVLYGRSLGGGVAVYLATKLGARALLVERTFHSMVDIGAELFWWAPVRWLMRNRYRSDVRILDYNGPYLQLHGTADEIVPLESARKLFAACPSKNKQFIQIEGLGHNDVTPNSFLHAAKKLLDDEQ